MKKISRIILWAAVVIFVGMNVIVFNHAYCFTHFSATATVRPQKPEELSMAEKLKILFTGVAVPKPKNHIEPNREYETFRIQSHKKLEGWEIPVKNAKGVVILFHGYISCKANVLPYSNVFNEKGYTTVLIDFMGHGGSEGVETTIGFKEGRDVKAAFDFVKKKYHNSEIILHGSSMGAVAIMKSIEEYNIRPDKIILECPFGSMLQTAKGRFEVMGLPPSPFAQWLIFYGGLQTGFDAFAHNPTKYASKMNIPTVLFNGALDTRVSKKEIDEIYNNLKGPKELAILENSAHQIYLTNDSIYWNEVVDGFLEADY